MIAKTSGIRLEYVAGVISHQVLPVCDYLKDVLTEKKLQRLQKGTGFRALSIASPGECTSDYCVQAAEQIFAQGVERASVGALLFVTQTPDYTAPSTAYAMQDRLGLAKDLVAFDINLGCSGFVYGLYLAASILPTLNGKKVLLCCGDVATPLISPHEPGVRAITGDAGTCTLIGGDEGTETLFNITSYGERYRALIRPNGGARHPLSYKDSHLDTENAGNYSNMDGMGVLDFTMQDVPVNLRELMNAAGVCDEDLGAYLFHQPNRILIRSMSEQIAATPEKVISNSAQIGNTSSATIPLLLTEMGEEWKRRENHLSLLSGFGIGLSIASTIINLKDTNCLPTQHFHS